ncbi:hypothetical protein LWI29_004374 [Acer saccharum]|uniref:RNase H type-1 domain-containing protein n=1 Tax=Acer saccharum TaxID=4024 RepID=A0AA39SNS1_ACESA|nr:hypothetical protein LWI29_004374 [Acer saccharum]
MDSIGIGVAIRDSTGKVLVAVLKSVRGFYSAELGELLAVREGLILASNCLVEMDATNVAASIKDNKASIGDAGFVLEDVKALCVKVQVSECHATPRSRNTMAYNQSRLKHKAS